MRALLEAKIENMHRLRKTHVEDTMRRRIERIVKKILLKLGYAILPSSDLNNERVVEYPWVLRRIAMYEGGILDVGCSGSDLSVKLANQGLKVCGIDIYKKDLHAQGHPNFSFVLCDARWLPFVDNSFDFVIAVSTIEHIGIGYYGDLEDYEGDEKAVKEFLRVCNIMGKTFITVPYGKWAITSMQRTYDERALKRLVKGFGAEVQVEYFKKHNHFWRKSDKAIAEQVDSSSEVRSVACITFVKDNEKASLQTQ